MGREPSVSSANRHKSVERVGGQGQVRSGPSGTGVRGAFNRKAKPQASPSTTVHKSWVLGSPLCPCWCAASLYPSECRRQGDQGGTCPWKVAVSGAVPIKP